MSTVNRYFRRLGAMAVVAAFAVVSVSAVTHAQDQGAGTDTVEISAFEELRSIGVHEKYPLNGNYKLVADIDASGSRNLNDGAGFLPIGRHVLTYKEGVQVVNPDSAFTGTFDGGGHTVSGLYIKRTVSNGVDGSNIGLFGFTIGAKIRNVIVVADTVAGYGGVGALVGRQFGGAVENSAVSGTVVGEVDVGGLVGALEGGGTIKVCYSSAYVYGKNAINVGGLVGSASASSEITESYTVGRVIVDGDRKVGGLVGWLTDMAKVSSSYSIAEVVGKDASGVGGLVGNNDGQVRQCYSAGAVSGGSAVGGLIGTQDNNGSTLYSFWDKDRSKIAESGGGTGKTTDQMMDSSDNEVKNFVTADVAAWGISNNYPYLKNEFFPRQTITVTATLGGAFSGVTAAGGAEYAQIANRLVELNTVNARPALDTLNYGTVRTIADSLDGWYQVGSNAALAVGEYDGFSVVQASSESGATGKLKLSNLTAKSLAIEARFILKKYTMRYIAIKGQGNLVSKDDNEGELVADTLVKSVEYGSVSSVEASPRTGYRFIRWDWTDYIGEDKKSTDPVQTDTAMGDITYWAYFADSVSKVKLTYTAGLNGRLRVNGQGSSVSMHTDSLLYGANGPSIEAIVTTPNYRFVMWSDSVTANPRIDSTLTGDINVTALFDTIIVAVKSPDRVVPSAQFTVETARIQPAKATYGGLTAGPNPALRQNGTVALYWQGTEIVKGTLQVFDESGNFVNKIDINGAYGGIGKRHIASWSLTNANGKPVGAGTYLIKGTLSTKNGKREKVLLALQLI